MTLEQLKLAVDELTQDERDALAEYLMASNEAEGETLEAWLNEAERRLENFERGETKGVPYEDVIQKLRGTQA